MFLLIPMLAIIFGVTASQMVKIITQQQAAKALSVSDRTIRNWISEGLITGYRLPNARAIRVDLDEITSKMTTIPTAFKPRVPFGPKATIVELMDTAEARAPQFVRPGVLRAEVINREAGGQDPAESEAESEMAGGGGR